MNIRDILNQIAEQELAAKEGTKIAEPIASGSEPGAKAGSRSADDGATLGAKEGTDDHDPVKSGSAPGAKAGTRSIDDGQSLEAKPAGTKISEPIAAVTRGRGTEVQGNKIMEELDATVDALDEAWWEGASKRTPDENKAALKASLKASVAKATEKHAEKKEKEDDMEEACGSAKKKMMESIEKSLNEGTEFTVSISEEMGELLQKTELTEEFASSAIEIIEAAVQSLAKSHLEKVNAYASEVVTEAFEAYTLDLEERVDAFLVAEAAQWAEDNKLAIEQSVRTRIAESFMDGLKDLLESHNIELPEEKVDMYEEAIEKGEEILAQYNEAAAKNAELSEEITSLKKKLFVEGYVSGMVETQAEKIRELAESLEFDSEESFTSKLDTLKESFVKVEEKKTELVLEDVNPVVEEVTTPAQLTDVEILASQISRLVKR